MFLIVHKRYEHRTLRTFSIYISEICSVPFKDLIYISGREHFFSAQVLLLMRSIKGHPNPTPPHLSHFRATGMLRADSIVNVNSFCYIGNGSETVLSASTHGRWRWAMIDWLHAGVSQSSPPSPLSGLFSFQTSHVTGQIISKWTLRRILTTEDQLWWTSKAAGAPVGSTVAIHVPSIWSGCLRNHLRLNQMSADSSVIRCRMSAARTYCWASGLSAWIYNFRTLSPLWLRVL